MAQPQFLAMPELEAGFDAIRQSPRDDGRIEQIVCRPGQGQRQLLDQARLDVELGLVGDNWKARGYRKSPDGAAHPDMQLTIMNARCIALIAQDPVRWALAGDQLYVDLDLGVENLPPGTRLALGTAVVEVTAEPHTGCRWFADRFGKDAVKFVNSPEGKQLRLRGLNAKVIRSGTVRVGERACKWTGASAADRID